MPDISMCANENCELKLTCYRFVAPPNPYRQTYFSPPNPVDGHCNYFMEVWGKSTVTDGRDTVGQPGKD